MIGKCNTDVYTKKMYTKYLIWPINWMNIKSPSEKNHCQQYCIGFIVNYVKQHTLQRHASGAFNRLQGVYATLRNFLLQLLGSASAFLGNLYLQKTDRFLIVYFSRSVLSNTSQSE